LTCYVIIVAITIAITIIAIVTILSMPLLLIGLIIFITKGDTTHHPGLQCFLLSLHAIIQIELYTY